LFDVVGFLGFSFFSGVRIYLIVAHHRVFHVPLCSVPLVSGLLCWQGGEGVEQDYEQALKWTGLAVAQGSADAKTNLGSMYVSHTNTHLSHPPIAHGLAGVSTHVGTNLRACF